MRGKRTPGIKEREQATVSSRLLDVQVVTVGSGRDRPTSTVSCERQSTHADQGKRGGLGDGRERGVFCGQGEGTSKRRPTIRVLGGSEVDRTVHVFAGVDAADEEVASLGRRDGGDGVCVERDRDGRAVQRGRSPDRAVEGRVGDLGKSGRLSGESVDREG